MGSSEARRRRARSLIFVLALASAALAGMYALKRATPYGLGLVNDSAAYVGGAESILAGRGFTRITGGDQERPITHFPPLLSVLLSATGLIGIDVLDGARAIILMLFACSILLSGWMALLLTGSRAWSVLAAFLFASSDVLLRVYSMALSEPLFLALLLSALFLMSQSYASRNVAWLTGAGLAIGLACLTRYTGIVLLGASFVSLGYIPSSASSRWKALAAITLPSGILLGGWVIRNLLVADTATNRVAVWHPVTLPQVTLGLLNLVAWATPDGLVSGWTGLDTTLSILSWAGLFALTIWLVRLRPLALKTNPPLATAHILSWFVVLYVVSLALSISLFDASTPLDSRLFSPAIVSVQLLVVTFLAWSWRGRRTLGRTVIAIFLLVLVATSVWDAVSAVRTLEVDGQGFASLSWKHSRAVGAIRELPADRLLYSDRPTAIYLLTGRGSFVAPTPTDPATTLPRPEYAVDLENMRRRVLEENAVLVLFESMSAEDSETVRWRRELTDRLPILGEYNDGTLFGKP